MKKLVIGLMAAGSLNATLASAQELSIEVTNLTNGIYFTPLLVSAHNHSVDLFEPGSTASASLQAMAEGGDVSGLVSDLEAAGADNVVNPAEGLLAPGATAYADLSTGKRNRYLSVVAMLLPTNDGFAGLDAISIPKRRGTYTYYINGYDAGTEANNEIINGGGAPGVPGIPADPGGNSGSGASGVTDTEHNTSVHIHRGTLGDMQADGGISDLDSSVHHWLNPVAKVVITVHRKRRNDD
ncbi:MAG TPA: hypothetical protein ENJ80_14765 [Gammaproteobacteria bacterium]|nr:hypothetical protein [Gammaproteobacteria bacterium]